MLSTEGKVINFQGALQSNVATDSNEIIHLCSKLGFQMFNIECIVRQIIFN